ncbi:YhgE/Pip domain-containing protein [Bacillus sp. ISL-47]|uniref:YhgE/Pip domain-containing protein n=1 Tax=Bacillus sp. ISL-47 TaxID=2819130 RepID=UPI001BEC9E67|nr:YhgE/Pip domain-containing protein [Bacillus sp. ISL-47]MBT2688949.1 YhgE/Pip domain-containing protein [Bacillus sp. ISL-47]MBT2708772.1 YhgE/Pip domain-containing protein [Pseudomonas sp. ISL-84]
MKSSLFKKELSAVVKDKKLLIPIIAVLFIPILYSGMFLWAFWDPYDHLEDLPVAIVNEDAGAYFEDKELKLGNELVDKLKESKDFDFKFVNKEEGYKNLENQKYYMLVEIPEDFSENATTLLNDRPQKMKLIYVPNESYNFLSAQIGGTAVDKIKESLSEKVTETYAETMFEKMGELSDGLEQASEGANKISEGAAELKAGSLTLQEKLALLADKSLKFQGGLSSASEGSQEIAAGARSLSDGLVQLEEGQIKLKDASTQLESGSEELSSGISQVKEGMFTINEKFPGMISGTEQLQNGAITLSSSLERWQFEAQNLSAGAAQLEQNLQAVISKLPEDSAEKAELTAVLDQLKTGSAQLAQSAGQISAGGAEISQKAGQLNEGQKQLQQGINQLTEGSAKLETGSQELVKGHHDFQAGMDMFGRKFAEAREGAGQLADGTAELSGGLAQLSQGSLAFAGGAKQLEDGAVKMAEGNFEIYEGSSELAGKLAEGAEKSSLANANDETFNMLAKPVKVDNEKMNEVPNYGTGFAPYFLSLGLFVGALLLSIVFPMREPAAIPRSSVSWFLGKFLILCGAGIIQAVIAALILLGGLGLEVQSVTLFILYTIITSLTYISLIQFLVTVFGDPGRFAAIIILILQLTTSAGTFPLELIPNALQPINAYLPMTYSVSGFKAVISSGNFDFLQENAVILLLFTALFIAGTFIYFTAMYKKRFAAVVQQLD